MIVLEKIKRLVAKSISQPVYAARVLHKRMLAYAYYHFAVGKSILPESVTLFLTHRCNLRCKMCGQWGERGVTKTMEAESVKEELDLHEYEKLIGELAFFHPNITLFGGEPLLYASCIPMIRFIKQKKMHCLMITNGFLLKRYAEDIVDAGLDELNLSLDGDKEMHNDIRGMEGLFETIVEGLAEIQNVKEAQRKKKPLINLQCTITKYNYEHLERLLSVGEDVKANSLTFHNLIFLHDAIMEKQKICDAELGGSSHNWEGFVFDPEIDPEILYNKIQQIQKIRTPFPVNFYPYFSQKGLNDYYRNSSYTPVEYPGRCLSPWIVAYIFPDGEVRPCLNSTYTFGTIKQSRFTDIWNSNQAIHFRNLLKGQKIFPACVRCTELYRY